MPGVLSWADFWLWLTSRYPARAVPADLLLLGLVVGARPGGLYARVSVDGHPHMVNVTTLPGQFFRPGQTVILSHAGAALLGLKGRTAAAPSSFLSDEGGGFVPPPVPSRETPQRPEPDYRPNVDGDGRYSGQHTNAYQGFNSGMLFDTGKYAPVFVFNLMNYIDRYALTLQYDTSVTFVYAPNDAAVIEVRQVDVDQANELPEVGAAYEETYRTYGSGPSFYIDQYQTAQAFYDFASNNGVDVPTIGFCLLGNNVRFADKRDPRPITKTYTHHAKQTDGYRFDGETIEHDAVTQPEGYASVGYPVNYYGIFDGGKRGVVGILDDTDHTEYIDVTYTFKPRRSTISSCHWLFYLKASYFNSVLVEPLGFSIEYIGQVVGDSRNILSYTTSYAGIIWDISESGSAPGVLFPAEISNSELTKYKAVDGIIIHFDSASDIDLRDPPPETIFYSPEVNGHSFTVKPNTPEYLSNTEFNSISDASIYIDGQKIGGDWSDWTAFNDGIDLTIVLRSRSEVMVIPKMIVADAVTVAIADFLADLDRPGAEIAGFSSHFGHHSYPQDRGYMLISDSSGRRWASFGPWDAYRDVSKTKWTAQGLSKPLTRAKYKKGQELNPPARKPLRPAHGLALYDLFPGQGSDT